jgi:hypothetical protein
LEEEEVVEGIPAGIEWLRPREKLPKAPGWLRPSCDAVAKVACGADARRLPPADSSGPLGKTPAS